MAVTSAVSAPSKLERNDSLRGVRAAAARGLPGLRRELNPFIESEVLAEPLERARASVRAKVEQPFRVGKHRFGYAKLRYRGLAKNTARLTMMFALGNLWMARRHARAARA